jgi:hypothetical protein
MLSASVFGFDLSWSPRGVWHFVDDRVLLEEPGRTLVCMHSQPPGLNALFWVSLAAETYAGVPIAVAEFAILALFAFIGLASLACALRVCVGERTAAILTALVAVSPCFLRHGHQFFYTFPVFALVSVSLLAMILYVRRPGLPYLAVLSVSLLVLVLFRSLHHPAFVALCLISAVGLGRVVSGALPVRRWSGAAALVLLASSVLFALPLKNLILNGAFVTSSWQGYNLARAVPGGRAQQLLASIDAEGSAGLDALPQNGCRDAPVNANPVRTIFGVESRNMHSDHLLAAMEAMVEEGVRWRIEHPEAALNTIVQFYARATGPSFSRQFGGTRADDPTFSAYSQAVFAPLFHRVDVKGAEISLFGLVLLPGLLLAATALVFMLSRREPIQASAVLFSVMWIVWSIAVPVLTDGQESPRMRFGATVPLVVLSAIVVHGAVTLWHGRKQW